MKNSYINKGEKVD